MLTTCYALIVPGVESIIIDAPRDAWRGALDAADAAEAPISLVVATHGHWDHITDMARLQDRGIPVAGHLADLGLFHNPMNYYDELPFIIDPVHIDQPLHEGDRLSVGDLEIQVLHTPGHTWGGVSLWVPELDTLFTGDTVLKGGAGYLDRPESDAQALVASVRRIAGFPESTTLYPGHGPPTTVGAETWLSDAEDPEYLIDEWLHGNRRWIPRQG